jgi:hypothetical protein
LRWSASVDSPPRAWPSPAKRIAAAATSPNDIVPKSFNAVIHASGAAGTTVRSTPSGIVPPCSRMNRSIGNVIGQCPRPAMVTTLPAPVRIMIGATPAKFTSSGCRTASAMPAQQPASMALPPFSRIENAAAAAR